MNGHHPAVVLCVVVLTAVAGCGDDTSRLSSSDGGGAGEGGGGGGNVGGTTATWPGWDGCEPGTTPQGDGSCIPAGEGAGISAELCAAGFDSDGEGGCVPLLPEVACEPGMMALPGELTCRELAACGSAPWGDIPVDGNTQHVDVNYGGGSSDGSAGQPWTTIQQAVTAATPGAIVAVAAGSFVENVSINGKAVRLWGRCPALVSIDAVGQQPAVLINGAQGAELHTIAISGPAEGVWVTSDALLVDRVWVHGTGDIGLYAEGVSGLAVNDSLFETTSRTAVLMMAASAVIERTVMRDTQPRADGQWGRGLTVLDDLAGNRSDVTLRSSLIDANLEVGLFLLGSDAWVVGSVIRDTELRLSDDSQGRGISVHADPDNDQRGVLVLTQSVVDNNRLYGVVSFGSDITVDASVVSGTRPEGDSGPYGWGIVAQDMGSDDTRSVALVRNSLVIGNTGTGIMVASSDAVIESTIIRDTAPNANNQKRGRGLSVQDGMAVGAATTALVTDSVLTNNREAGIAVLGAELILESSRVEDTREQASDLGFGRGISLDAHDGRRSTAAIRFSSLTANREAAVIVNGSDVIIESSVLADTRMMASDDFAGVGLMLQPAGGLRSTAEVRSSLLSNNHRAGIGVLGSDVLIERSLIVGTLADASEEAFADAVVVVSYAGIPAFGSVTDSYFHDNARAGVAIFGANMSLGNNLIACNAFQLNGEEHGGAPFLFEDLGENTCGCAGGFDPCKVLSVGLEPPAPL